MTNHETADPTAAIEVFARLLCTADIHVYGDEHPTWQKLSRKVQDDYRKAARWLLPRMTVATRAAAVSVPPPAPRADAEAIARVRAVHHPASDWSWKPLGCQHDGEHAAPCRGCRGECWPCPTIRALEGEPQPGGPCVAGEQQNETPEAEPEFVGTQPCGHDDYHDSHEWADRPGVWCPGIGYDEEA